MCWVTIHYRTSLFGKESDNTPRELCSRLCGNARFSQCDLFRLPEQERHIWSYLEVTRAHQSGHKTGFRVNLSRKYVFSKTMYIYNTLGAVMILCYLDESDNKRFPHHMMWKLVNRIYICLLPITLHHVSTSHDVQLLLSDFLMTHSYTIVSHHVM